MKRTLLHSLLTFFLWFVATSLTHAQILIVADSVFCSEPWAQLLHATEVQTVVLNPSDSLPDASLQPARAILFVPPSDWFRLKADPEQTCHRVEQMAQTLITVNPSAVLYVSTGLPSDNPNVNRKQQEMVQLLLKEFAADNRRVRLLDLYTPLTEKLNIAVSPYPTSAKTRAEVLARKLRSPIPYRQADDRFLFHGRLTSEGRLLLAKILKKKLKL